jgi:hypothetical protein
VADNLVEVIALILLPVAVLMCAYALTVFVWRSRAIAKKSARCPRSPPPLRARPAPRCVDMCASALPPALCARARARAFSVRGAFERAPSPQVQAEHYRFIPNT